LFYRRTARQNTERQAAHTAGAYGIGSRMSEDYRQFFTRAQPVYVHKRSSTDEFCTIIQQPFSIYQLNLFSG
jgi:hypothetical protein